MKHFGDITKLSGYDLPVVDIITGGSPCQDLSVAGKRAGLDGERSGLFMEQIRIVREMRERDRADGRTNDNIRPRYMVWENVPGAFSSNKGKDFQSVLTEIVKIVEPESPDVPMPDGGGKWSYAGCLYDYMGRWSIAWRVHDAQFWGVPQRRKRIALVADFGGMSAPEILFERTCVPGDPEQGAETGEATAGSTGEGVAAASKCLNPCEVHGIADALYSGEKTWGGGISCLYDAYQHHGYREGETCGTLTKDQNGSVRGDTPLVCYGISAYESNAMKSNNPNSGIYEADTSRTLDNNGGNPACNQGGIAVVTGAYCLQGNGIDRADTAGCNGKGWREDQSYTLNTIDRPAVMAYRKKKPSAK